MKLIVLWCSYTPLFIFPFLSACVDVTDAIAFTAVEQSPIYLSSFLTGGRGCSFINWKTHSNFHLFGDIYMLWSLEIFALMMIFLCLGMLQTVENPITLEKTDQGWVKSLWFRFCLSVCVLTFICKHNHLRYSCRTCTYIFRLSLIFCKNTLIETFFCNEGNLWLPFHLTLYLFSKDVF